MPFEDHPLQPAKTGDLHRRFVRLTFLNIVANLTLN